jgi:hypothetical protein
MTNRPPNLLQNPVRKPTATAPMGWIHKILSAAGLGKSNAKVQTDIPRLLTRASKRELELLLRDRLMRFYDQHGTAALLQPDVFVVIDADGPRVQTGRPTGTSFLAAVETRTLPSALAMLAVGQQDIVVPRGVVKHLGTEATSALAAIINKSYESATRPGKPGG